MNDVQNIETPSKDYTQELNDGSWEDAILARWEDAEKLSEDTPEATPVNDELEETTDDDLENDEEETTDDAEDTEGDSDEKADQDTDDDDEEVEDDDSEAVEMSDDTEVEIMVDGKAHQTSIKDLKRLYGMDKSLTRKSQETAERRKEAEDAISKSQVVFDKLVKQAQERYEPYQKVDMLVAAKEMSTEDFTALRKEAQDAYQNLQFLTEEADSYYGGLKAQQAELQKTAAVECVKVLQEQIPEWSNALYNDIRHYAIAQGLPENDVNQYVDPAVVLLIHKARLYDEAKKVSTVKKKKSAAKQKVLRSKKAPQNDADAKKSDVDKQLAQLRANGGNDMDDIANVFLKRWDA
jgi:hypothetical protein